MISFQEEIEKIYHMAMAEQNLSLALKVKELELKLQNKRKSDETLTPDILQEWLRVIDKHIQKEQNLSATPIGQKC